MRSLRYSKYIEMIDFNQNDNFLNVAVRLEPTELINYRSYPKLQEIIGRLGGLWNVLFTIIIVLLKPLSYISY